MSKYCGIAKQSVGECLKTIISSMIDPSTMVYIWVTPSTDMGHMLVNGESFTSGKSEALLSVSP